MKKKGEQFRGVSLSTCSRTTKHSDKSGETEQDIKEQSRKMKEDRMGSEVWGGLLIFNRYSNVHHHHECLLG